MILIDPLSWCVLTWIYLTLDRGLLRIFVFLRLRWNERNLDRNFFHLVDITESILDISYIFAYYMHSLHFRAFKFRISAERSAAHPLLYFQKNDYSNFIS